MVFHSILGGLGLIRHPMVANCQVKLWTQARLMGSPNGTVDQVPLKVVSPRRSLSMKPRVDQVGLEIVSGLTNDPTLQPISRQATTIRKTLPASSLLLSSRSLQDWNGQSLGEARHQTSQMS